MIRDRGNGILGIGIKSDRIRLLLKRIRILQTRRIRRELDKVGVPPHGYEINGSGDGWICEVEIHDSCTLVDLRATVFGNKDRDVGIIGLSLSIVEEVASIREEEGGFAVIV